MSSVGLVHFVVSIFFPPTVRWNFHKPWRNAGRSSARTGPQASADRRITVTVATIIFLQRPHELFRGSIEHTLPFRLDGAATDFILS
jgi:hypothetical protein